MSFLLAVSRAIDALNRAVGHAVYWLILAAVLVSAGNAVSRYLFNLSSNASFQPIPFQATYAATKAFVRSFTDALHEELRGTGVTATAVSPGPVRTEFGDQGGFGGGDDRIPGFMWISAEKVAEDALDALESGVRVVVPGPLNRVAAMYGHYLPRSVLLPIVRRVWPVS